jgi:hypothetical protein
MRVASKNQPTDPKLWEKAKAKAKSRYKIWPSAYAVGHALKVYKDEGGGWKKGKTAGEHFILKQNMNRDQIEAARAARVASCYLVAKAKNDVSKEKPRGDKIPFSKEEGEIANEVFKALRKASLSPNLEGMVRVVVSRYLQASLLKSAKPDYDAYVAKKRRSNEKPLSREEWESKIFGSDKTKADKTKADTSGGKTRAKKNWGDNIHVEYFERPALKKKIEDLGNPSREDLMLLSGVGPVKAGDGSSCKIRAVGDNIEVSGQIKPFVTYFNRTISEKDGNIIITNEELMVTDDAPLGTGTRIFANQVFEAREVGADFIKCLAHSDPKRGYNGAAVWPKLGYDGVIPVDQPADDFVSDKTTGPIPKHLIDQFEELKFKPPYRISHLMQVDGGPEWWDDNAVTFNAEFDLSDDSYSMRVLRAYLKKRAERDGVSEEKWLNQPITPPKGYKEKKEKAESDPFAGLVLM